MTTTLAVSTTPPARPRDDRRARMARAAIEVLGRDGSRGFTHRAIDRELALPDGTTSAYFRRRADLLLAALTAMIEEDMATLDEHFGPLLAADAPPTVEAAADRIQLFTETIAARAGAHPLARVEAYLLAQREASLRQPLGALVARREAFWVAIFTRLGAADATRAADLFDVMLRGIFYQRTLLAGMTRPPRLGRRAFRRMLAIALQEGQTG